MTLDTKTGIAEFTNAAHHPMLLYRGKDNTLQTLDTPGLPIGVDAQRDDMTLVIWTPTVTVMEEKKIAVAS